ncbi:MAG: aspartate ammonia-lyase [Actinobacteria bacterium]|nr:aspartate ammonia-lyase [Actinomycetota bacterium]
MSVAAEGVRRERDLLGERDVPRAAYYGIHTLRALENFPVSGNPIASHPHLIWGLAAVKEAAAAANRQIGVLDPAKADAIVAACREIREGALRDQFRVDVFQGGAGTSTNMNANEVIANRALELLGHPRGAYEFLHPLDDVNAGQSTNDVYPTAARVALDRAAGDLAAGLGQLRAAFADRAAEFADVVKMGRTQLQDAVPMTVGQELATYAVMIGEDELRLGEARLLLREVNLGGTAIGTGLNAAPGYRAAVCEWLAGIVGHELRSAPDLVEATQDCGAFVQLSGVLKRIAMKLSKTCNDLRLLSSGPRAGLGELNLPPVQAGSSMMPGKVNPVIPELVNQIAFEVAGNDVTVSMAAEGGQLQLNAFEPVIVHRLLDGFAHLTAGCELLATRCVGGITVNRARLEQTVEGSIGLATALNPYLGYATSTAIAQEAMRSGRGVLTLVRERGLLDPADLERILASGRMTGSGDEKL